MPIIIPQVEPQTVNPPRLEPVANETTFGGGPGLAAEGEQIQKTAGASNEIAEFGKLEKIRNDQIAVQAATSQLDAIHNNLINDPDAGLPAYKGANAMAGHDHVIAEYQKNANDIAKTLQPDQQGAFNKFALQGFKTLNDHAMGYVRGQMEQHDTNTYAAALQNKIQLASNNYANPDAVKTMKDQIDLMAGARAKRLGLNPEETEDFMRKAHTNFHESVLSQMVNDPNAMGQAKQYFKANKGEMDVESQDRVRNLIDAVPKQRTAEAKAAQTEFYKNNMKQAMLDMFDGKMTLSEAQRRFRNGQLDKADYDTLENRLHEPDANKTRSFNQSDPKTFNEIRQSLLDGSKDPGEIQRMISKGTTTRQGDKYLITDEDGKYLTGLNREKPPTPRDRDIDSHAKTIRDFGDQFFATTNIFGVQTDASKKKTSEESEAIVNDFYNRVDKGHVQSEDLADVRDQVLKTAAAKRYPGLGKLDKMPDVVIDVKGKVTRLLNPDQHSGLKPKYTITKTAEADKDAKEE
jgi:hypothetical protein